MKNKGVLFSIIVILCFGIFVTMNTRRLTSGVASSQPEPGSSFAGVASSDAPSQSLQREAGPEEAKPPKPAGGAAAEPMAAAAVDMAAGQIPVAPLSQDEAVPEAAVAEPETEAAGQEQMKARSSVTISPLTGSNEAGEVEIKVSLSRADYEKKFLELDSQIKKMKDSVIEANTDSMKKMADHEYWLWDNELNSIYQTLIGKMNEQEAEALRSAEREWLGIRDQTARKASEKYSGGTLESLEYTASLAASTRTRTYELLEQYGSYLEQNTSGHTPEQATIETTAETAGGGES